LTFNLGDPFPFLHLENLLLATKALFLELQLGAKFLLAALLLLLLIGDTTSLGFQFLLLRLENFFLALLVDENGSFLLGLLLQLQGCLLLLLLHSQLLLLHGDGLLFCEKDPFLLDLLLRVQCCLLLLLHGQKLLLLDVCLLLQLHPHHFLLFFPLTLSLHPERRIDSHLLLILNWQIDTLLTAHIDLLELSNPRHEEHLLGGSALAELLLLCQSCTSERFFLLQTSCQCFILLRLSNPSHLLEVCQQCFPKRTTAR
jgi:hypothetical protein